ncbi:MAG: transglycosylase SLT domain-containing protein [Bacteroidota bacterium]
MEIVIPMTTHSFWRADQVHQVKDALSAIRAHFGNAINEAAGLTGVSTDLITSFIFIESGGDVSALSASGASGLMQVAPATAPGIIFLTKKAGKLNGMLKAKLVAMLGERIANIEKQKYMDQKVSGRTSISQAELMAPGFNILIGAMMLALLIPQHIENGKIRLDKVVTRYNRGYFHKPTGTTEQLLATSPRETQAYILKLVGVNSTLDILT